jgi:tryptophan-rich sensory protein
MQIAHAPHHSRDGARGILALALFVLACLAVGALGGWITRPAIPAWYAGLAKPGWTPPDWLFAPVWTALYLAMAVAAWLVWRAQGWRAPLWLWTAQLVLNCAWSLLFFGLRSPGLGLLDIVPQWLLILATTVAFWRVRPPAGALMAPLFAWVGYALALNLAVWRLN